MPSYVAPDYEELYKKNYANVDTSAYKNLMNQYAQNAEKNRARQLGEAQQNQQSQLKQAYISRLQNQKQLNQNLAMSGIRGGTTETSNLRLANQYGQARASANSDYSNNVNTINQNIDQNIMDYNMDMQSRAEEYRQNQAHTMATAQRDDSLNQFNSAVEYWNNYYLDYYSGFSKKAVKKALKKIQKKYNEAKKNNDTTLMIRYEQAIRGARNRLGAIKNK